MFEALNWVRESIGDAIEDFEDGNDEGIPLVPIMDYAMNAMESSEFQQMLLALGLCSPTDEQVENRAFRRTNRHLQQIQCNLTNPCSRKHTGVFREVCPFR